MLSLATAAARSRSGTCLGFFIVPGNIQSMQILHSVQSIFSLFMVFVGQSLHFNHSSTFAKRCPNIKLIELFGTCMFYLDKQTATFQPACMIEVCKTEVV